MTHASYDPILVTLSIAIAIFAAYTALELTARTRSPTTQATSQTTTQTASPPETRTRALWIAAAALAMGGGIWSMHFVGMLALHTPVPVTYRLLPTILSFLVAVGATAAAFFWIDRPRPSPASRIQALSLAGTAMGAAIAGMHYIGMSAMRMPMDLGFMPARVALSIAIAIAASIAGLAIAFRRNTIALRIPAAIVMGLAVAGMHYTGMWAAHFEHRPGIAAGNPAFAEPQIGTIGTGGLALWVLLVTFLILFLALIASAVIQHRNQRALRVSEARFRVAAQAVGDIIWTNSADGRMTAPQPGWQTFTGQTPAEFENYGWAAVIHPDDRAATTTDWQRAVDTTSPFVTEHRVRRTDGTWRLCAVRAMPVLDDAGQVQEWVGVHEDITERHQAELDLRTARDHAEAASHAKSTFIANMSHELRTPLTAIIGYAETMEEVLDDDLPKPQLQSELRSDLAKLQSNARHLIGLINDILDLSRIEAGRLELTLQPVDVLAMVDDLATTLHPTIQRRANRLLLDLPPTLPPIDTDPAKLRQILLNLLGNAAKFTQGGTITLAIAHDPAAATLALTIADTGIGMTEDQRARLFQPFTQADASTTRRFGGTGLGLAITKAFTDLLSGTITVHSTPGQGSTFTITLPT